MTIRRNVLIFHQGALGDFVLTWPLAMAAGRLFAQSRVVYVTHAGKGALAEKVLRVESADAEGGWHALFSSQPTPLPERAQKLLEGAHTVVSFVANPEDAWTQNVSKLVPGAQIVCVQSKPPDHAQIH